VKGLRFLIAAIAAAGVTIGLFLFMFTLISAGGKDRAERDAIAGIHFGPVRIADEITTRRRIKPQMPPPPGDPPSRPKMPISKTDRPVRNNPQIAIPDLDIPLVPGEGLFIGSVPPLDRSAEGDIIPLVVIRPLYPHEAAMSGIEGWVKVEFTITETGSVKNPRVVDSDPPRIFNREAIRAILKWKFKPQVIDGVAVERRATQLIEFNLDKS